MKNRLKIKKWSGIKRGQHNKCIVCGMCSGALTGISYCIPKLWWLVLVSLIPLWYGITQDNRKKSILFVYGFTLHLLVLSFFYCLLPELGLPKVIGVLFMSLALLVASALLAAEYVFVFLPYVWMIKGQKQTAWSGWLFAASYGMAEWLQECFFYPAFPWLRLSAVVTPCPLLLQEAAWLGGSFITVKLVLWNVLLYEVMHWFGSTEQDRKELRRLLAGAAGYVFLFVMAMLQMQETLSETMEQTKNQFQMNEVKREQEPFTTIKILLVQGNFSGEEKWTAGVSEMQQRYLRLSREGISGETDFVIWPETALPVVLKQNAALQAELASFCEEYAVELLVGALDKENDGKYNAMYHVTALGMSEDIYYKQKLAPFGEYMPFAKILNPLLPQTLRTEGFMAGTKEEAVLFQTHYGKVGTLICFESLFSGVARDLVKKGAGLLVIASNDSWFDASAALYQHHAHAMVRAVETGRYVARVGNTGITSVIAPNGQVLTQAVAGEEAVLTGEVKFLTKQTPYVKYGDGWLLVIFFICLGYGLRKRSKIYEKCDTL